MLRRETFRVHGIFPFNSKDTFYLTIIENASISIIIDEISMHAPFSIFNQDDYEIPISTVVEQCILPCKKKRYPVINNDMDSSQLLSFNNGCELESEIKYLNSNNTVLEIQYQGYNQSEVQRLVRKGEDLVFLFKISNPFIDINTSYQFSISSIVEVLYHQY